MVKKTIILASLLLSGLTYANDYQGQTTEPIGSLHPVEMVCKTSPGFHVQVTLPLPQGYVVVGEIHHQSCTGGGKNAWLTKVLESGDAICATPHGKAISQYADTINWFMYEIVSESYSTNCPYFYDPITKTRQTNVMIVEPKAVENPYCNSELPPNYIANYLLVGVGATDSCPSNSAVRSKQFYKPATNSLEYNCSFDHFAGYFKKQLSYRTICGESEYKIGNSIDLEIPQRGIVYKVLSNPNYEFTDWITTQISPDSSSGKLPSAIVETMCIQSKAIPPGYRAISANYNPDCANGNPEVTPNQLQIKKIMDEEEVFCTMLPNYFPHDASIPNDYILIEELNLPQCYVSSSNQNNAYKIRKLKSNDTVCKAYFYSGDRLNNQSPSPFYGEDDYGIIGETTLESCGNNNNNAYFIKKLSKTDTVCEAWFYHEYYPDYVIDSVGYMPSCPGTGNNAYNLRQINEPEDVICTYAPYSNYYYSFNNNGFEIIGLEDKTQCGHLQGFRIRLR